MTFQKGQSGNPNGRPKTGESFAAALARGLDRVKNGTSTRERIAAVVLAKAEQGDLEAVKWIVDRVDGKMAERLQADVAARVDHGIAEPTLTDILAHAARKRALGDGAA